MGSCPFGGRRLNGFILEKYQAHYIVHPEFAFAKKKKMDFIDRFAECHSAGRGGRPENPADLKRS
jgi:hypothetical protein